MNTTKLGTRILLIIALFGATTLVGCDKRTSENQATASSGVTDANVATKIEGASTAADHEALAKYYDERTRLAQAEAVNDSEARTRYERRWNPNEHLMGGRAREHYNHMVEQREGEAGDYHAMADWHREMAQHAQREPAADE
jgi:hypothetical protein